MRPSNVKGVRDYLPAETARRRSVMVCLGNIFKRYGYVEIETPVLTPAEVIFGRYGNTNERLVYHFQDKGGRKLALPYDLTVPFARYIASNYPELPMPFKRYQIANVWRAEKPQRGRLREFIQCDIDIIGSKSLLCEGEIFKLVNEVLYEFSIERVSIKVNSRRLLNEIILSSGVPATNLVNALKVIDKLKMATEEKTTRRLLEMGAENPNALIKMLQVEDTNEATLRKLDHFDLTEIKTFLDSVEKFDVNKKIICIDPGLVRGLKYYTGIVFEVEASDSYGRPLCAGGRYDDLCEKFCDKNFSGVGASFNIDQILSASKKHQRGRAMAHSQVLIAQFGGEKGRHLQLKLFNKLIRSDISSEIFLGDGSLEKQFRFASKKNIPFVVIYGDDELQKGSVSVKRMDSSKQKVLPEALLVPYIKGYYDSA